MATIVDVARLANVSVATVSRYLNGQLKIKEETAKRIDEVIKETKYLKNVNAASIKTKKSKTIAMIFPSLQNLLFAEIAAAANDVLSEHGYSLVTYTTGDRIDKEKEACQKTREHSVAGAILITQPMGLVETDYIDTLEEHGIKSVFIDRFFKPSKHTSICVDYCYGVKEIIKSSYKSGRKKIGLIVGWEEQNQTKECVRGYKEGIKEVGLEINMNLIKYSYYSKEKMAEISAELIDDGVDMIICISDYLAIVSRDIIKEYEMDIPKDIGLFGIGNTEYARLTNMTSLDSKRGLIGTKAANLLLDKINGKKTDNFNVVYPSIVQRKTT